MITSIVYFMNKERDLKIMITSMLFIGLTIPLFGLNFFKSPRNLIPKEWYDRYDVDKEVKISLPWNYESSVAKALSDSAFQLREIEQFENAVDLYMSSLEIEYNPETLLEISTALANVNKLEEAIQYLDTLIIIDPTFAGSYNNRGLMYYKLKENQKAITDFKKAIELDSNLPTFHSNLALAYYYTHQYDQACKEIDIAVRLGSDILTINTYRSIIKKMKCK